MGGGGGEIKETADQIQEQKNNVSLYNYYLEQYKPYIDKHITKVTSNLNSGVQSEKLAGQVNAEVMKAASANTDDPRQPNALNTVRQLNTAAGVGADAQIDAEGKLKRRQLGSQQNFIDIGRGQQTEAQQGQDTIAAGSLRKAISDKESELRTQGVIENSIGSAIGTAAGAYMRGGGNALSDVQTNAGPYTDGGTGVTDGKYAGQDLYAGNLY